MARTNEHAGERSQSDGSGSQPKRALHEAEHFLSPVAKQHTAVDSKERPAKQVSALKSVPLSRY